MKVLLRHEYSFTMLDVAKLAVDMSNRIKESAENPNINFNEIETNSYKKHLLKNAEYISTIREYTDLVITRDAYSAKGVYAQNSLTNSRMSIEKKMELSGLAFACFETSKIMDELSVEFENEHKI